MTYEEFEGRLDYIFEKASENCKDDLKLQKCKKELVNECYRLNRECNTLTFLNRDLTVRNDALVSFNQDLIVKNNNLKVLFESKNDWIFTKEKPPKVGQRVAIIDAFDQMHLAKVESNIYAKGFLDYRLNTHDRVVLELDDVCAWFPIPEKPKKGE